MGHVALKIIEGGIYVVKKGADGVAEGVRIGCNSHPTAQRACRAASDATKVGADWISEVSQAGIEQIPQGVRNHVEESWSGLGQFINEIQQSYHASGERADERFDLVYGISSELTQQMYDDVAHVAGDLLGAKVLKLVGKGYRANGPFLPPSDGINQVTGKVASTIFQGVKNVWDYPAELASHRGSLLFSAPVIPTRVSGMKTKDMVRLFQQSGYVMVPKRGKGGHKMLQKPVCPNMITIPSGKTLSYGMEARLLKVLRKG